MKVFAKNDDVKRLITHPQGNIAFREDGSAEWPDDSFTHRRIMDGDVTTEEPKAVHEETRAAPATKKAPPDTK